MPRPSFLAQLKIVLDVLWICICYTPTLFMEMYYNIFGRQEKDVKGQIVMVTGSGQGVGRELCLRFARLGCKVICVELIPENNQETLKLIREAGGKAEGYTCDVSDRKAIVKLAEAVERVDILINNAGIYPFKGIWNATEQEIRTVLDVNLMSQLWTVQAFLPGMKERNHGHVVAISSIAALVGMPYFHAYAISKAAVTALMTTLAHELRIEKKTNVKMTTIHPYFINTRSEITECCTARIPPLDVGEAVDEIMRGILQEHNSFTVPRELQLMVNMTSIYPYSFMQKWLETFPYHLDLPKVDLFKQMLTNTFNQNTGTIQIQ